MALGIKQIYETPTVTPKDACCVDESTLRASHILGAVIELLEAGTPAPVILHLIEDMEGSPLPGDRKWAS